MTESELIHNCQTGDRQAFKLLVERYASKLKGICIRYMKDDFLAQDVLQESFIIIFKSINRYKTIGSFEGWMYKITVRCALQELRKNKKKLIYLDVNTTVKEVVHDAEIELDLNEEDILSMINQLADHYRIIFNMYEIEGYSHAEIAELLEIGESTSRTKLSRAKKKIQQIYYKRMNVHYSKETRVYEK